MIHDVIVVGAGGMGSAALMHLARRGLRVLGIEQFQIAHDRGSSHGESRLIRRAYFEHPDYVPLVSRAYQLWRELENVSGRTLFHRTGLFLAGPENGSIIGGVLQAARIHGLDIESVPQEQWSSRFPGLTPDPGMTVLYESDAGYLAVEDCVRAHIEGALAAGADLRLQESVTRWSVKPDAVTVETDAGVYAAKCLVLCGGPWSQKVAAAWSLPLHIRRKVVAWFETKKGAYAAPNLSWKPSSITTPRKGHAEKGTSDQAGAGSPVFCFDAPQGFFYGFPSTDGLTIKVGEHSGGQVVASPEALNRELHADDEAPLRQFVEKHLPLAIPRIVKHSVCMYTMTPDEHFIVDRHPHHANVAIACGFSGHGFKFAPVIGSVLADLVTLGRTDEPIGFLRFDRFGEVNKGRA